MKKTVFVLFIIFVILKLVLSLLDYTGSSSPELHDRILKYFTEEDILRGESYSRAGFGVSIVKSIVLAGMILAMSFTSLSGRLERFCLRLSKNRLFMTSLLYIMIAYSFLTLIMLPFNYYLSFIAEHRFGFSNMTMGFWFWTKLKSFLLRLIFISLIGSAALLLIKKFKVYSILIIPLSGLFIGLVMVILYPVTILPMFYDIKFIDNPSLEKKVVELTGKTGFAVEEIYVIKESDYSKHTNAFFVGFGNYRKIYLYDTLIQNNSEGEVLSILSHEIGHWVYNHNMKGILGGFTLFLAAFCMIYFCVKKILIESGLSAGEMYSPSIIPLYLLLYMVFSGFADPAENVISRNMEKSADYYALTLTGDPDSFISSEISIARDNRSRLNRHPVAAFLWSSHPSAVERVEMAENFRKLNSAQY